CARRPLWGDYFDYW
nr:immunoglobulin heavy chain junction region [Mus musculus]MBK4198764.1 immunoglobulin heavy chain junction region [Mus musculus]MBK4198765.1 immunoglobulin heavy chain junction region [Mus musculus]